MNTAFDVVVGGAGPAGLCAALRLQQLGYQVLLLERSQAWPRPRIGASLTPGCKSIIDLLGANAALAAVPRRTGLPTRLVWSKPAPELLPQPESHLIDRAGFDAALLQLARTRGIAVRQPAYISTLEGAPGDWHLTLAGPAGGEQVRARWLLEAGGRADDSPTRLACAPALALLWQDISDLPGELGIGLATEWANATRLEACEAGWLWGLPLPGAGYRLMLLHEPNPVGPTNAPDQALQRLRQQCGTSQLFAALADAPLKAAPGTALHHSDCTPYIDEQCWQPGRIKLGEAAFALDPVSASGMEKAMRCALQAVIALHTIEFCDDAAHQALAQDYFRQHIAETCARHSLWAARHYRQAWCHDLPFWHRRSTLSLPDGASGASGAAGQALCAALAQEVQHLQHYRPPKPYSGPMLRSDQVMRFAPQASMANVPCVIENRVQQHPAIIHPHLERPLVFMENEALLPRLGLLQEQPTLAMLLDVLSQSMTMPKAQRILGWLWQRGVIEAL
jgi:2-polyprenyl-6-methoxyphenol hydroxylase-like FAD-dependent oxidoreductase